VRGIENCKLKIANRKIAGDEGGFGEFAIFNLQFSFFNGSIQYR
jgi:hypothetical protein